MKIAKAIIPVAGYGSRLFPVTKAVEKEMLPVLNRPIVDYVVEDCVKAGINEIYFIILPEDTQIRSYYSENTKLKDYFLSRNGEEKYKKIADVHRQANFHFIEQPQNGRYGTALPVQLAKDVLDKDEHFLVLMGDDFIYNSDGTSEVSNMIAEATKAGDVSLLATTKVPRKSVSNYGVVSYKEKEGRKFLESFVEKPGPNEAPSNIINISKYIFHTDIFKYLSEVKPNPNGGEYNINDAFEGYMSEHPMMVYEIKGQYLDGGSPKGLLRANIIVGRDHPELVGDIDELCK